MKHILAGWTSVHLAKNWLLADKNEEEQAATVHVEKVKEANNDLKKPLEISKNKIGSWITINLNLFNNNGLPPKV